MYSRSGGAQFGQAARAEDDLLIVYAEAFERDADPADYSLRAMIAHERGHQIVVRHPTISRLIAVRLSARAEEIVASVLGAIIVADRKDENMLINKALFELLIRGEVPETALSKIENLRSVLEKLL